MKKTVKMWNANNQKKGFSTNGRSGLVLQMRKKVVVSQLKNNKGQGLVEYVLVLVLMALLAVGTVRSLGAKTHNAFYQAGQTMDNSTSQAAGDGDSTHHINVE